MDYVDMFHPSYENLLDSNNFEKHMYSFKGNDTGYNKVTRQFQKNDGRLKRKSIDTYASSSVGSNIRDAETGQYYQHLVGSSDEDLYFKISYSTGECNSANGSNILFYLSPRHCIDHLNFDIDQETIASWEEKKNARLRFLEKKNRQ
jgi:hypothetical protein